MSDTTKPKKVLTEAQRLAFLKGREKRMANILKKKEEKLAAEQMEKQLLLEEEQGGDTEPETESELDPEPEPEPEPDVKPRHVTPPPPIPKLTIRKRKTATPEPKTDFEKNFNAFMDRFGQFEESVKSQFKELAAIKEMPPPPPPPKADSPKPKRSYVKRAATVPDVSTSAASKPGFSWY